MMRQSTADDTTRWRQPTHMPPPQAYIESSTRTHLPHEYSKGVHVDTTRHLPKAQHLCGSGWDSRRQRRHGSQSAACWLKNEICNQRCEQRQRERKQLTSEQPHISCRHTPTQTHTWRHVAHCSHSARGVVGVVLLDGAAQAQIRQLSGESTGRAGTRGDQHVARILSQHHVPNIMCQQDEHV